MTQKLSVVTKLPPAMSPHAVERMAQQGIPQSWIDATLAQSNWTEPDPRPGRTRYFRAIPERGNRVLRVVLEGHIVVTAHFDRDAPRRRPSHV
jgi:hypothetical protein